MSDLRYDPIFGQWACIAEKRQTRPFEFQQITQRRAGIDCPFCKGNESVTPPAILEWSVVQSESKNPESSEAESSGPSTFSKTDWVIRVLPNKFPAFDHSLVIRHAASNQTEQSLFDVTKTIEHPLQEVIVLSPRHVASLSGLEDIELFASFTVFQQRVRFHSKRPEINHVCLFMNCRPLAGASIEHSHFQLIASPVCTDQVKDRMQRMNSFENESSEYCTWRSLLQWESQQQIRVIHESDEFLVYCPFASRFSNQIRIAPKNTGSFQDLSRVSLHVLAKLCRRYIDGIERCLGDPAYNLIFHLPPTESEAQQIAWFVDLVPRFPQAAGFELATDCWVNPVSPESAAEQFRQFGETI